jgi:Ca2+-binding RTX toxin-like protein
VVNIDAFAGNGFSSSASVPVGKVSSITIDGMGEDDLGRGGDDEVDLDSIQALIPVTIRFGAGTKPYTNSFPKVYLTPDDGDLGNLFGSAVNIQTVLADGYDAYVSVIAQDFGPKLLPHTYTLTDQYLMRSGSGVVYLCPGTLHTHLELNTGGSNNVIHIDKSLPNDPDWDGPPVVVNMSPGDRTTVDQSLQGDVQVFGYKNSGTLAIEDGGWSDDLSLGATSIHLMHGKVTYSGVGDLAFHGGDGSTVWLTGAYPCAVDLSGADSFFRLNGTGSTRVKIIGNADNSYASTLYMNNGDTTWHITGPDSGDINGCITFQGVAHWIEDRGTHRFVFSQGAWSYDSVQSYTGNIILDFSDFEVPVTVNLADLDPGAFTPSEPFILGVTGTVTEVIGGSAGDTLIGDGTPDQILRGGPGNDVIRGGAGPAVLCGNDGNDTLIAGCGRNILIGGTGADHLYGGTGDDILIGGYTSYDGTFAVVLASQASSIAAGGSEAALRALIVEWANPNETYARRLANISLGLPGTAKLTNGVYALNTTTVFQDYALDRLYGGGGSNWYWADPGYLQWMNGRWVYMIGDLEFA